MWFPIRAPLTPVVDVVWLTRLMQRRSLATFTFRTAGVSQRPAIRYVFYPARTFRLRASQLLFFSRCVSLELILSVHSTLDSSHTFKAIELDLTLKLIIFHKLRHLAKSRVSTQRLRVCSWNFSAMPYCTGIMYFWFWWQCCHCRLSVAVALSRRLLLPVHHTYLRFSVGMSHPSVTVPAILAFSVSAAISGCRSMSHALI